MPGNVSRIASGKITDVGTSIEAGGDVVQQSGAFESKVGSNTSSRHDESSAHSGRLVAYAKAGAGASADANANATAGLGHLGGNSLDKDHDSSTDTRAGASAGARMEYSYKSESKDAGTATDVVATIKAGGNITIGTAGAMRLEGTQLKSGGAMDLSGRRIDILAAGNSASSSSADTSASGTLSAGTGVGSNSPLEGGLNGKMENKTDNATRSSARAAGFLRCRRRYGHTQPERPADGRHKTDGWRKRRCQRYRQYRLAGCATRASQRQARYPVI